LPPPLVIEVTITWNEAKFILPCLWNNNLAFVIRTQVYWMWYLTTLACFYHDIYLCVCGGKRPIHPTLMPNVVFSNVAQIWRFKKLLKFSIWNILQFFMTYALKNLGIHLTKQIWIHFIFHLTNMHFPVFKLKLITEPPCQDPCWSRSTKK
jgi:hypothetical protein